MIRYATDCAIGPHAIPLGRLLLRRLAGSVKRLLKTQYPILNDMERSDGQKSKATTHKANGLDESAYSGAKTVFEGQATGEENFKADETYHWRIAPKSESVRN